MPGRGGMRFRDHQDAARAATRRLLVLFALVLLGLVAAVNGALALVYRFSFPFTQGWPPFFFETNTAVVLMFVLGGCWIEMLRLREGGAHVAKLAGGRLVAEPRDLREKRLLNVVDELAIASGMRRAPPVYLLPREDGINAFAAGWREDDAVVAVTQGALERLTRDELQGVMAHEISHILHEDVALNMRLIGLVWGLQMLHGFGRSLCEVDVRGRRGAAFLFGAALVAVGSVGWVAGRLLKAAVSRQREYLADASAMQFTRHPDGIGGALRKIADQASEGRDAMRSPQAESLSHLLFSSRLDWHGFFATHPPLQERLRRIYGHDVEPLPARTLEPVDDDAPQAAPRLALVPLRPPAARFTPSAASQRPASERPFVPAPPDDPDRLAREKEAEALRRLRARHGPGERRATVLALLMEPGNAQELQAWRAEVESLSCARAVLADVQALTPAARLPALELMLRRCAGAPPASPEWRRELLTAARRVMLVDGRIAPLDRLRWLAMRRLLDGAPAAAPPPGPHNSVEALFAPAAVLTAFLAGLVDAPQAGAPQGGPEPAWYRLALQALATGQPLPPWQPPDGAALSRALDALAPLAAMQRPRLAKAWLQAAQQQRGGAAPGGEAADALRLACLLLDTPLPGPVAALYLPLVEDPPRPAA